MVERHARPARPPVPVLQRPHPGVDRSAARVARPRRRHPVGAAAPGARRVARGRPDLPLGALDRLDALGARGRGARPPGAGAALRGLSHDRAAHADGRHDRPARDGTRAAATVDVALRRLRRVGDGRGRRAAPGARPAPRVPGRRPARRARRAGREAPAAPAAPRRRRRRGHGRRRPARRRLRRRALDGAGARRLHADRRGRTGGVGRRCDRLACVRRRAPRLRRGGARDGRAGRVCRSRVATRIRRCAPSLR